MSTTVFVPIYKVYASYIVQQGRIWTPLEHMILCRLTKGSASTIDLAHAASVPVNLVIESLIELMEAGYIRIHPHESGLLFDATASGREASRVETLPPDYRTRKRRTLLCMDRLVATFLKPEDLTLVHRENLPAEAVVLNPRAFRLTISPSSTLDHLYMLEDESFQEWVDYRVTSQNYYALTSVVGDDIPSLPRYASALKQAILEEVTPADSGAAERVEVEPPVRVDFDTRHCCTEITAADIIVGGPEHLDLVKKVIKQAKSLVVIHTCFVHPGAVGMLLPTLEAAAKHGTKIELLWGQRTDELQAWSRQAFAEVKAMFDGLPQAVRSRLRFAIQETGSHAKLVLADSGPNGAYEAYVGSCNWLSARYKAIEVSVRISEPWLVGYLASALASLRIPTSARWTPDVYRLVQVYNTCKRGIRRPTAGPHSMSIILDREHLGVVRQARDASPRRVIAGCDLYGPAGETSVFVPMRTAAKTATNVTLLYNRLTQSLSAEHRDKAVAALNKLGINVRAHDGLHGKFFIWDQESFVISSFNWLATTPDPWKPSGSEIGVFAQGPGVGTKLEEKIMGALGAISVPPDQSAP